MEDLNQTPKERTLEEMRASEERYLAKRNVTLDAPTPAMNEYMRLLNEKAAKQKDVSVNALIGQYAGLVQRKPRFIPYAVKAEDARELFYAIIQMELADFNKNVVSDGNFQDVVTNLFYYFLGLDGKYDLNKGIYLWGPIGTGKTSLFEFLGKMCHVLEERLKVAQIPFTPRQFKTIHAAAMVQEVAQKKTLDVLKKYETGNWLLDDLGADETYKHFGNDVNILGEVITQRYIHFKRSKCITHATSNISYRDWKDKYTTRVESRMHDMFNIVGLSGNDKRLM